MRLAVRTFMRAISPRGWAAIAIVVAVLMAALWIYNAGGDAVREDVDDEAAQAEVKAGANREVAATERALDTAAITQRQQERDHAAEQTPDSLPDDRELRRRCRQLWDHGFRDVAECRRFTR